MSTEQRENLDAILRQSAFPAGLDVSEQRRLLRELTSAQPLPADVTVTAAELGGVPTAEITADEPDPAMSSCTSTAACTYWATPSRPPAWPRRSAGGHTPKSSPSTTGSPPNTPTRQRSTTLSRPTKPSCRRHSPVGHHLRGRIRGGGLAIATLVNARDHGLPLPAAAFVMSPYADLTLAGTTMDTKRDADPLLSRENLQARVPDYTSGHDAALALISPIFADLSGLPPLIIQAGTHEVLLDDAIRLARQAATADVGHPRHHPRRTARLPGLLPHPRRSSHRTRQSRTAPISTPHHHRTRHRIAKDRNVTGSRNHGSFGRKRF